MNGLCLCVIHLRSIFSPIHFWITCETGDGEREREREIECMCENGIFQFIFIIIYVSTGKHSHCAHLRIILELVMFVTTYPMHTRRNKNKLVENGNRSIPFHSQCFHSVSILCVLQILYSL